MRASDCVAALRDILVSSSDFSDFEIVSVVNNASAAVPGCLFCAIRGAKFDGHDFLAGAVKNGAAFLAVHESCPEEKIPHGVPFVKVTDSYAAWGRLCALAEGRPASRLRVHGITGTNGKTSTAMLLHHFLTCAAKRRCGLLTTIFTDVCGEGREESANTMPDAAALQKLFRRLAENGAQDVVMECSSHGLSQSRSGDVRYASAVFTNLTGDHLDYHGTMEAYFQAKKRLFTDFAGPGMPAVIHVDDPYGKRLYDELEHAPVRRIGVSFQNPASECFVKNYTLFESETEIELVLFGRTLNFTTHLTGRHNICNTVCAMAAAAALGADPDALALAAESAPAAPGRLEGFLLKSGAHAFVDYAHTDDALLRVTDALNALKKPGGRLIAVFGCGGDRDRTKRPRMGKAAAEHSDVVIVTSDNPRTEDPLSIIREIEKGIPAGTAYSVEPDRAKAIALAASLARNGDLVLIAGKGHETYQEINGVRRHFDDREEIRRFM